MSFDKLAVINEAIEAREAEIGMYEINIFNYETMLEALVEPIEDPEMSAHRDRIVELLASEKREKAKSELVLAALTTQRDMLST